LAATEVTCLGRRWLTGLAVFVVVFESLTVLVLRAHYTMDVFTGIVTGALRGAARQSYFDIAQDNHVGAAGR
jgi:hypothetical protein